MMRSTEQINLIKQTQSDPWQIENFLSTAEVENLKDYFFSKQSLLDQKSRKLGHLGLIGPEANHKGGANAIQFVLDRLQEQVGKFEVRNATFFLATQPHRIHNDDAKHLPRTFKAFTMPLWVESGNCENAKLIMFEQFYYGGPTKFLGGDSDELRNKDRGVRYDNKISYNLYNYDTVEGINDKGIDADIKTKYLSHIPPNHIEGLSILKMFDWKIGSVVGFDSLRLHCASNFRKAGISKKLGLAVFTTHKN